MPDTQRIDRVLDLITARGITWLQPILKNKLTDILAATKSCPQTLVESHFSQVRDPEHYIEYFDRDRIVLHVTLISRLANNAPVVVSVSQSGNDRFDVLIAGIDRLGAFACITGNTLALRLNIVRMEVVTYNQDTSPRFDSNEPRYVMDLTVSSPPGSGSAPELEEQLTKRITDVYPSEVVRHGGGSFSSPMSEAVTRINVKSIESRGPALESISDKNSTKNCSEDTSQTGDPDSVNRLSTDEMVPGLLGRQTMSLFSLITAATVASATTPGPCLTNASSPVTLPGAVGLLARSQDDQEGHEMSTEDELQLELSERTFEKDLADLLQKYQGEWVAYVGSQRVGLAHTKRTILEKCYAAGHKDERLFVARIEPTRTLRTI